LGRAHLANQNWQEAADALARVQADAPEYMQVLPGYARALLETETPEAALAFGERQLLKLQKAGYAAWQIESRLEFAEIMLRFPEPPRERIDRELELARELTDQTGSDLHVPKIHEIRAQLNPESREAELRQALRLYTEMQSAHAGRIERELAR